MCAVAVPPATGCVFCAIVESAVEASVVHDDEHAVAFMDLNPMTPGHLLVVPRRHVAGLEDLDEETSTHVWRLAHRLARALRRSGLRCEGINVFMADGEVAFQEVFHFHLHVIARHAGDGFTINAEGKQRSRSLLDADARAIRSALVNS